MSRRRKQKRPVTDYLQSAKSLSKFAPALKKYSKRKTLKPQEKAAIARKEKILRYAHHLIPVSKKTARKLKGKLFAPGIRAVQLNNTSDHAKVAVVNKELFVTSNGRDWLYWDVEGAKPADMKRAATQAFTNVRDAFPIEKIAALVHKAFRKPTTREVYLWTAQGRVGQGFESLKQFLRWFNREYHGYSQPEKWINGIAIRLGEVPRRPQKLDDFEEDEEDDEFNENDEDF